MEDRRQAEYDNSYGALIVYDELSKGGVIVANRLLDLPHRLVHLFAMRARIVSAIYTDTTSGTTPDIGI